MTGQPLTEEQLESFEGLVKELEALIAEARSEVRALRDLLEPDASREAGR